MSDLGIINIIAWALCALIGFQLAFDFIKTELHFAKENKNDMKRTDENGKE